MKKTVATCDCCPSQATEEVNLEGGQTLDFCDACVMSAQAMTTVLLACKKIREQRNRYASTQSVLAQQGWQGQQR